MDNKKIFGYNSQFCFFHLHTLAENCIKVPSQQLPLFVFGEAGALRGAFALASAVNGRVDDPKLDLSPRPIYNADES